MNGFDRRVVISGSMSQLPRMLEEQRLLEEAGVPAVVPPADEQVMEDLTLEEYQAAKCRAAREHLQKVMDPRTFAVLAVNADKHGIRHYMGPNTFAEVAVAFALGKHIYLLQDIPETLEDELRAWGAVPLRGNLSRLISDYFELSGKGNGETVCPLRR
jgi:hypothetical protein